jgi:protein-S-isoprenylcysteine O-methyltransferase Ste14
MTPEAASSLVVAGIYRVTRNPMYLGFLLILLGWAAWLSNVLALLPLAGFVIYMNVFQIRPEERALEALFGPEFEAYKKQVRRWI